MCIYMKEQLRRYIYMKYSLFLLNCSSIFFISAAFRVKPSVLS